MLPSHFITQPLANGSGYTWTLASRLGQMLKIAESQFGSRDKSWTVLGIEIGTNVPQLWYPGNCGHIVIQLAPNARDNNVLAHYQLAHECIHLLAPTGKRDAPVLEEGLATVFSEDYVLQEFGTSGHTDQGSYADAARFTRSLLSLAPDAIKRLRTLEPSFALLRAEHFELSKLAVPADLVTDLLRPFAR